MDKSVIAIITAMVYAVVIYFSFDSFYTLLISKLFECSLRLLTFAHVYTYWDLFESLYVFCEKLHSNARNTRTREICPSSFLWAEKVCLESQTNLIRKLACDSLVNAYVCMYLRTFLSPMGCENDWMKRKRVDCDIFRDVFVWKQSSDDSAKNNCRRGECTIGFLISYQLQKRFELY